MSNQEHNDSVFRILFVFVGMAGKVVEKNASQVRFRGM